MVLLIQLILYFVLGWRHAALCENAEIPSHSSANASFLLNNETAYEFDAIPLLNNSSVSQVETANASYSAHNESVFDSDAISYAQNISVAKVNETDTLNRTHSTIDSGNLTFYMLEMSFSLNIYFRFRLDYNTTSYQSGEDGNSVNTSIAGLLLKLYQSQYGKLNVTSVASTSTYYYNPYSQVVNFELLAEIGQNEEEAEQSFNALSSSLVHVIRDNELSARMSELTSYDSMYVTSSSLAISQSYSLRKKFKRRPLSPPSPGLKLEELHLMMIGDWGKGGVAGDITNLSYASSSVNQNNEDKHKKETTSSSSSRSPQAKQNRNLRSEINFAGKDKDDPGRNDGHKNDRGGRGRVEYTYQYAIAKSMAVYAENVFVSSIIGLGDNFYDNGVYSVSDTLWWRLWRKVYSFNSMSSIPWYTVLGNHDYGYGEVGVIAQIEQGLNPNTSLGTSMCKTFSTNYSLSYGLANGATLDIICIDTTTLAPSANKCCNEEGGISYAMQMERINNQLYHIEQMLRQSRERNATWILIVGHYPIFSAGEHGDSEELQMYLLPLIKRYSVDAYICGHDHISEHLSANGTQYIVAGAGAMTDQLGNKASVAELNWYGTGYSAFLGVSVLNHTLNFSFINIYGETVYSTAIWKSFDEAPYDAIKPTKSSDDDKAEHGDGSDNGGDTNSAATSSVSSNNDTSQLLIVGFTLFGIVAVLIATVYWLVLGRTYSSLHREDSKLPTAEQNEEHTVDLFFSQHNEPSLSASGMRAHNPMQAEELHDVSLDPSRAAQGPKNSSGLRPLSLFLVSSRSNKYSDMFLDSSPDTA